MIAATSPTVHVTNHAVDRLFSRCRDETASMSAGAARELVRREVTEALVAGRVACRNPRWCSVSGKRARASRNGAHKRHVWNETESRCYVVRRETGAWVVLSTYARRAA